MKKNRLKFLIIFFFSLIFGLLGPKLAGAATLSVSPSGGTYAVDSIFSIDILIDTAGANSDGFDIHSLNYNPSLLEIQDANTEKTGIQPVEPGTLFPNTIINSVDIDNGKINFSQITTGGSHYTGIGKIGTITFKVKSSGTADFNFSFSSSSSTDCNVASEGKDILTLVTNGSYTLIVPSNGDNGGGYTPATPVLSVSISAIPISGNAPLLGIDLKADVSGTAKGNINYTFYCNRSDSNTNITSGYCKKEDNTDLESYTAFDCCNYVSAGTYTVKVIVEREDLAVEDRKTVTVLELSEPEPEPEPETEPESELEPEPGPEPESELEPEPDFLESESLESPDSTIKADFKKVDINKDGYVNSVDYSFLIINWGKVSAGIETDFNEDSIVDELDWDLMNREWTL